MAFQISDALANGISRVLYSNQATMVHNKVLPPNDELGASMQAAGRWES
jgi:hypothetical protein